MSLQSFSYFAFLALVAVLYLRLPKKAQTPLLFAASSVFYLFQLHTTWVSVLSAKNGGLAAAIFRCGLSAGLLVFLAVFVWRMALCLSAAQDARRHRLIRISVFVLLGVLAVFKYYNLSPLPTIFAGSVFEKLPFPLGISFFTFAALGYLIDVSRGDCPAEKSFVHTAVFLFFFATVTCGPICRGAKILPQLDAEHRFDETRTVNALRLFAIGLFRKVAVADVLGLFVDTVFGSLSAYGAPTLLAALIFYTFQLYFDFSGYSDMARASGLLLGIELPENFKTPFFATNFSGFWARWHISLSAWLQDYLFMPLAWADVSKTPLLGHALSKKYEHFPAEFCVFIVFFCSGLWHGSTLPFLVWGLMQALYRVGEELCHRRFGKPKKRGVKPAVLWAKRFGVFVLWSASMVLFRVGSGPYTDTNSLADAGAFFAGLARGWAPARFFAECYAVIAAGFYAQPVMVVAWTAFIVFGFAVCLYLDAQRFFKFKSAPAETVLAGQKPAVKWLLYYALILGILAGLMIQNGGFGGGTSFAYAGY